MQENYYETACTDLYSCSRMILSNSKAELKFLQ